MTSVRSLLVPFLVGPFLRAATVEERLDQLEARVSEMQILVEQLARQDNKPASKPAPGSAGSSYQVRTGDSYWSIAHRHGISVDALTRANPGIKPRRLPIGKTITIPGGSSSRSTSNTAQTKPSGSTTNYEVRRGDVMGHIAKAHGISLSDLLAANPDVDPRKMRIGSTLAIPGQKQIAKNPPVETKSGIPEESEPEISEPAPAESVADNLDSPPVDPYQKVLDSASSSASKLGAKDSFEIPSVPNLITLAKDSRFSEIASRFNTTVAHLNELNGRELSPDQMIKAGSQIYVPAE